MPTQKYYNLVDQKKDGILRAMGEELLEHSYQEITVSRIIERAGISRASFYSYFKDKEDMLGCIFQRLKEDTSERLLEHVQEEKGDALKGISRFLDYLLEDKRGQSVCRIFHSLRCFSGKACDPVKLTNDAVSLFPTAISTVLLCPRVDLLLTVCDPHTALGQISTYDFNGGRWCLPENIRQLISNSPGL